MFSRLFFFVWLLLRFADVVARPNQLGPLAWSSS